MFIKPTKGAKNLADFNEEIYMDALLYPAHDEVPCPWDADIDIQDDIVVLEGGLGPSGAGYCQCKCKIEDFSKYYKLEVPNDTDLTGSGWVKA